MNLSVGEILDALQNDDQAPLADWLREKLVINGGCSADQFELVPRLASWNSEAGNAGKKPEDRLRFIEATLEGIYSAARHVTYGIPMLNIYLWSLCRESWEYSWEVDAIFDIISAARHCSNSRQGEAAPETVSAENGLSLELLNLLEEEIKVEIAAASGSLACHGRQARITEERAAALQSYAARCPHNPLVDFAGRNAADERIYYRAVATAAGAADRYISGKHSSAQLVDAITALKTAEDEVSTDEDASELRAHRRSLECLHEARDRPQLLVENARITYIYPFGLIGITPEQAVQHIRGLEQAPVPWSLAGVVPEGIDHELQLDDIWMVDDPFHREYGGAAVRLPAIVVPGLSGQRDSTLRPELRFSELGNHVLRIETEIVDATPQDLYAALSRVTAQSADMHRLDAPIHLESNDTEDRPKWGKLIYFARSMLRAIPQQEPFSELDVQVSFRTGSYHTLVWIKKARAGLPCREEAARTVEHAAELRSIFGFQTLCNPVSYGPTSVAEWAQLPLGSGLVIQAPQLNDDLVLWNGNNSMVAAFGSPNFQVEGVLELAEFAASLPGLFSAWNRNLAGFIESLRRRRDFFARYLNPEREGALEGPASRGDIDAADLPNPQAVRTLQALKAAQYNLEREAFRFQNLIMASRLTLMFMVSPALVTSTVARKTLDELMAAADFEKARRDYVHMVDEVLGDLMRSLTEQVVNRHQELHDEHELEAREANRRKIEILLAGLAGIGLSGLASIVRDGYNMEHETAILVVLVVVALVGAICVVVYWMNRHHEQLPPGRAEPGATWLNSTETEGPRTDQPGLRFPRADRST
ncbi:hypothetical protein ACFQ36_18640 [Arthrobacter sp. GCM10027362]|uniref:hypothetical protein n=1 Tax=Arthrobacter sp. GCM10027362 TaxID=3273379 RepID=UPI003640F8F4